MVMSRPWLIILTWTVIGFNNIIRKRLVLKPALHYIIMITTKVFFPNSKGQKICAILEEFDTKSGRIVIIIHGYGSSKDGESSRAMASELSARGIASLRIDLNGCGESEGNFAFQTITSTVADAEAAIAYVKSLGYSDIALFGASAGGLTAMATALTHPEITALGLKCPVSDYVSQKIKRLGAPGVANWQQMGSLRYTDAHGRERTVDYSVFEDYRRHVMFDKVCAIPCPTLIVHGDADEIVDVEDSKRLVTQFPQGKLVIIPGANHRFTNETDRMHLQALFGEFYASTS